MSVSRGDVVLVDFPLASGTAGKMRPAVVIQANNLNRRIANTILVQITTNLRFVNREPTHILVDPQTPEGHGSGLLGASSVSCANVATVEQSRIARTIGRLSPELMARVDGGVRIAVDV